MPRNSETLHDYLDSNGIWHRFIEFSDLVKTVEQSAKKVPVERIVKSIVMIASNGDPLLAIVRAGDKVSFRKIKRLLSIKDVRLASPEEATSGFPAGGVAPFTSITTVLLDPSVLTNQTCLVGGWDVNKLLEVMISDILEKVRPGIANIRDEREKGG